MNDALFLFLILLLGLLLCSFLGGNCGKEAFETKNSNNVIKNNATGTGKPMSTNFDNYNHFNGSSTSTQLQNGATFTGKNGGSVVVSVNSDGQASLQVKLSSDGNVMTFTPKTTTSPSSIDNTTTESYTNYYGQHGSASTFYGPNGETATVIYTDSGQQAVNIQTSSGSYTFTQSGSVYNPNNMSSTQYYGSTGSVTGPYGNTAYYAQGPNGNTVAGTTDATSTNTYNPYYNSTSSTQYYGPYGGSAGAATGPYGNTAYYAQTPSGTTATGTTSGTSSGTTQYYGPYGGSAGAATGPYGNTAYYAQTPSGTTATGTTTGSSSDYYSSLPPGIPANQIPSGQEDLYILKSQVVPPVCPACPGYNQSSSSSNNDPDSAPKCPPCPACARCPEPSFDCKKVPNYNAINDNYLPQPVISDFSSFGM